MQVPLMALCRLRLSFSNPVCLVSPQGKGKLGMENVLTSGLKDISVVRMS